jgi:transcriptional antiterminator RfaH
MEWYLIRARRFREEWVRDQLESCATEVFLPLLEARHQRGGKSGKSITPLFPCYVFARFDLQALYFHVKYMAGVIGLVSAGNEPLSVREFVVDEIKRRAVNGVVKIREKPFQTGERLRLADERFRDYEAIFDHYSSGRERVVILLNGVHYSGIRMTLPSSEVSRHLS